MRQREEKEVLDTIKAMSDLNTIMAGNGLRPRGSGQVASRLSGGGDISLRS
jgi:hypothetical protein